MSRRSTESYKCLQNKPLPEQEETQDDRLLNIPSHPIDADELQQLPPPEGAVPPLMDSQFTPINAPKRTTITGYSAPWLDTLNVTQMKVLTKLHWLDITTSAHHDDRSPNCHRFSGASLRSEISHSSSTLQSSPSIIIARWLPRTLCPHAMRRVSPSPLRVPWVRSLTLRELRDLSLW